MPTVLITGSNRGIGLEFARQYAQEGWTVFATCRTPDRADALQGIAREHKKLRVLPLDVADHDAIDALARSLRDETLDVLINNAGVPGDLDGSSIDRVDYDAWSRTLRINSMAPVKMLGAFLPQLGRGKRRLVVALTSMMGSMGDNRSGGAYLYRSSKAALNAAMVSAAVDLRPLGIGVLILHPGWVKTDMGGPDALITTQESVRAMRERIERFSLAESGRFLNYDGTKIPW